MIKYVEIKAQGHASPSSFSFVQMYGTRLTQRTSLPLAQRTTIPQALRFLLHTQYPRVLSTATKKSRTVSLEKKKQKHDEPWKFYLLSL